MASLSDIVRHMRPGCQFRTYVPPGGFGEITYWAPTNPLAQPSHEEIVAYATANAAVIEQDLYRKGLRAPIRALRRALLELPGVLGGQTLLDDADGLANDAATPREAREDWFYMSVAERTNPWIDVFGARLVLTADQIDALFERAKQIDRGA